MIIRKLQITVCFRRLKTLAFELGVGSPFLADYKNAYVFLHFTMVQGLSESIVKNKLLVTILSSDFLPLFDLRILNQVKP